MKAYLLPTAETLGLNKKEWSKICQKIQTIGKEAVKSIELLTNNSGWITRIVVILEISDMNTASEIVQEIRSKTYEKFNAYIPEQFIPDIPKTQT